jgi:signal transduction histidine kinase
MLNLRRLAQWRGPPLVLRILALLLGGLVVAQLVTLLLTILLPPAPLPRHRLDAVAAALRGAPIPAGRPDHLEQRIQSGPPDLAGGGWLVFEPARRDLAGLLHVAPDAVRLAFFTPLPFAGTLGKSLPPLAPTQAGYAMLVQNRPPGGGIPRGGFPEDRMRASGLPSGRFGGPWQPGSLPGGRGPAAGRPLAGTGALGQPMPGNAPQRFGQDGLAPGQTPRSAFGFGRSPALGGPNIGRDPRTLSSPLADTTRTAPASLFNRGIDWSLPAASPPAAAAPDPADDRPAAPVVAAPPARPVQTELRPAPPTVAPPRIFPVAIPVAAPPAVADRAAIPVRPVAGDMFGLVRPDFVEGDFVAALRLPDGRWRVVQPAPEPFPNYWQRRLLLWFLIAFTIVAPIGWLFARRIVRPLTGFVEAAEQLGRDPSAPVARLDGPAEVGRAAHAFNLMQSRLKSFVEDRTAMVGAISHDLRTPLTRLRFRLEDVEDDAVREGMIGEVAEMEAMISSVLSFIRDASTPGARERCDLRSIVEDVVEDARLIGGKVVLEEVAAARVEVDPLGIRRVLGNLLDNATKYGEHARVRLVVDKEEACAEIIDDGPGLPEDELERAFEPFYRSADARASAKQGSGLGLAVCRSIARAHGGDVRLLRAPDGFVAQLRVPLTFDAVRVAAA